MPEQEITCDNCEHTFRFDRDQDEELISCPECYAVVPESVIPSSEKEAEPNVSPVTGSDKGGDEIREPDPDREVRTGKAKPNVPRDSSKVRSRATRGTRTSRFSVTNVISTSFELFFNDFSSFVGLGAIILSPMVLVSLLMLFPGIGQSGMIVLGITNVVGSFVLTPLLSGAMMYGVIRKLNDQNFAISDCISEAVSMLLPLIGLSILQGIIIGGGPLLFFLIFFQAADTLAQVLIVGTVAFIILLIVALVAATMLYVCVPVLLIEKTGVIDALKRSYDLTSGNRLRIIGLISILFLIDLSLGFVVGFAPGGDFLNTLLSVLTYTLTSITIATTYYFLRLDKEGTTLDELVRLFD